MIKKIVTAVFMTILSGALMLSPVFAGNDTDEWLNDWDYEIKELDCDGDYIFLNKYTGTETDIGISGMAEVNGRNYPVCISVEGTDANSHYETGINRSKNLRQITFSTVNDVPVRSEMNDRLDDMFYGMENLEYVFFRGDFQGNVSQAVSMFEGCKSLRAVDIYDLDFGYCSNFRRMFYGCESLHNVTINCDNAENMEEMFTGCSNLEEVTLNCGQSDQSFAEGMFSGCQSLQNVNMEGRHFSSVKDFNSMFNDCSSLKSIDMGMFDFSSATDLSSMFSECSELESVDLTKAEWGSSTPAADYMFYDCAALEDLTVPESFRPETANQMLYVNPSDECIIRIKGDPSEEFLNNALSGLESSNRYLGQVKLRSKVELEGKELKSGMFRVGYNNTRHQIREVNSIMDDNIIELVVPVYFPGSNTFTIEETYDVNGSLVNPDYQPISRVAGISCRNAKRSKTVNITLERDGSLSVTE